MGLVITFYEAIRLWRRERFGHLTGSLVPATMNSTRERIVAVGLLACLALFPSAHGRPAESHLRFVERPRSGRSHEATFGHKRTDRGLQSTLIQKQTRKCFLCPEYFVLSPGLVRYECQASNAWELLLSECFCLRGSSLLVVLSAPHQLRRFAARGEVSPSAAEDSPFDEAAYEECEFIQRLVGLSRALNDWRPTKAAKST